MPNRVCTHKIKAVPFSDLACRDNRLTPTFTPILLPGIDKLYCVFLQSSACLQPYFVMRFSTSILLAVSSLLEATLAHNIQLAAHGRECFHEQLHKDDKMTVTFQIGDREFGSAGNLDIDFWVRWLTLLSITLTDWEQDIKSSRRL